MRERSGSAISHSFTSVLRLSSPFEIDLWNIPSSSGSVCTTWTHLHVLRSLMTCACLPSLTPWPTIMSICKSFGGKKNQSRRSKACGRGVACMIFALCSRAISLSSWLHFGKKKWFSLQGTWLTEWLILCLWLNSVFRALWLADAKIVTFTLRDPCTRSLGTFLSLRLISLVSCRLYMSSRAFQLRTWWTRHN